MPVLTKINTNSIAEDAITGDKFAGDSYLENTSNQNLSGTIAESRMYTSDAYTLSGDTTVNGNLVLSSVKEDGSDITLTTDSTTRTLTGTGKLIGGGTLQGRTSLTGMTGTLGSTTVAAGMTGELGNITITGTTTVSGDLVPSTPLSHRNMIINGGMQVWQRATAATAAGGYSTADRYFFGESGDGAYTSQKHTMSVAELNTTGHRTALQLNCTTADASVAAGHYGYIRHRTEAQDLQHLQYGTASAKTITLSFWVKSNKTGIYCVMIDAHYYIPIEYTISSADTWEKKTITISPTAGSTSLITTAAAVISDDNGTGLEIGFGLKWGSDFHGTNNTWTASGVYSTSNQVNWFDSTSNNFYITGIQLELGSNATPFEHRSYGEELRRCQRYYTIIPTQFGFSALGDGSSTAAINFTVPVPLRGTPAIEQINSVAARIYDNGTGSGFSNGLAYQSNTSTHITYNDYKTDTCNVKCVTASQSNLALGKNYQWVAVGSYKLGINAEL